MAQVVSSGCRAGRGFRCRCTLPRHIPLRRLHRPMPERPLHPPQVERLSVEPSPEGVPRDMRREPADSRSRDRDRKHQALSSAIPGRVGSSPGPWTPATWLPCGGVASVPGALGCPLDGVLRRQAQLRPPVAVPRFRRRASGCHRPVARARTSPTTPSPQASLGRRRQPTAASADRSGPGSRATRPSRPLRRLSRAAEPMAPNARARPASWRGGKRSNPQAVMVGALGATTPVYSSRNLWANGVSSHPSKFGDSTDTPVAEPCIPAKRWKANNDLRG